MAADTFPRYWRPEQAGLVASCPQPRRRTHLRYRPVHARPGACKQLANRVVWRAAILLPPVTTVIALLLAVAAPVLSAPQLAAASTVPMRVRALEWAEAQAGKPYIWGGTGPAGFDCSGLVMEAWLRGAGVHLPRTSYQIAADLGRLRIIPVSRARRGDILVWPGAGHVELKTRAANGSFGALEPGTRIGWHRWSRYWHPAFALALR